VKRIIKHKRITKLNISRKKVAKKIVKKVVRNILEKKVKNVSKNTSKLRTAVLFSGGKDSGLALKYAFEHTNVVCLIILKSKNPESYMFHTPNINLAQVQAGNVVVKRKSIPYIVQETDGQKEQELNDLENAIKLSIQKYKVQGVVTGAIESVYQASRIQRITNTLGIECFNPLWQRDQISVLKELIQKKFKVLIVGTFAYGMDKMIGRIIDEQFIKDISVLRDKYQINPAGEGGEFESFVLEAPYYKKNLFVKKSEIIKDSGSYLLKIQSIDALDK
jgi:ABC transporter with metal-binding/Fe-S-binding domain ATP-binding protein